MSLITKKQAGLILNRPERTILDWIENGVLKAHRVKSVLYVDSDTVYALKDTEADIDHALQERKAILQELDADLAEMRRVNHFNREDIRRTVRQFRFCFAKTSMIKFKKIFPVFNIKNQFFISLGENGFVRSHGREKV